MNAHLPREARDGLMRAWLEILTERHPGITWIPAGDATAEDANAKFDPTTIPESVAA